MVEPGMLRRVAAVAHECWQAQMRDNGWSYGEAYDADRKLHDALGDFETLSEQDQRSVLMCVRAENLVSYLAEAVDHPRGPERPFALAEMREGRPVQFAHGEPLHGTIAGWEVDKGQLTVIRVRWDNGRIDEFDPWLQALARPEELEQEN